MRVGYCTGFASNNPFSIEMELIDKVRETGFDYLELPLMAVSELSPREYDNLAETIKRLDLSCEVSCNFFPSYIPLIRKDASTCQIESYLKHTMKRASEIGTKKIIFGSSPARNKPDDMTLRLAEEKFVKLIRESIAPIARQTGIMILIEPIQKPFCNFIITLDDGARIVQKTGDDSVLLMADLCHLMQNGEEKETLERNFKLIRHIHISEADRAVIGMDFSEKLKAYLLKLKELGYDGTISLETRAASCESMNRQMRMVKAFFK